MPPTAFAVVVLCSGAVGILAALVLLVTVQQIVWKWKDHKRRAKLIKARIEIKLRALKGKEDEALLSERDDKFFADWKEMYDELGRHLKARPQDCL